MGKKYATHLSQSPVDDSLTFASVVPGVKNYRPKADTTRQSLASKSGTLSAAYLPTIKKADDTKDAITGIGAGSAGCDDEMTSFLASNVDAGHQRQMIRSNSSKRGDVAPDADKCSLGFDPDTIQGENRCGGGERP
jgi:hypothetical protein